MVMALLTGFSLAATSVLFVAYQHSERESRLLQLEVDSFRIELIKVGIITDHKGEKP